MAYYAELLAAARLLLARRAGQRGRLPAARVRRSISTYYYALFHFLAEEYGLQLIGGGNGLAGRRHLFTRTITHTALRSTLKKVRGARVADDVREFTRTNGRAGEPVAVPAFVRRMADTVLEAQDQRNQADYDLGRPVTADEAAQLIEDAGEATRAWRTADTPADRRVKKAVCLLITLRGRLRSDDG